MLNPESKSLLHWAGYMSGDLIEDMIGKTVTMRIPTETRKKMRAFWISAMETDENGTFTKILIDPKLVLAKDQRAAEMKVVQQLSNVNLDRVEVVAVPFGTGR